MLQELLRDGSPVNELVQDPAATTKSNACSDCLAKSIALCPGISAEERRNIKSLKKDFQRVPARQAIFYPREYLDFVAFVCSGWATSVVQSSTAARQIVSIFLPGDAISIRSLDKPMHDRLVEAVTDVAYRSFSLAQMREAIAKDSKFALAIIREFAAENEAADQLAADLGRRTATQRVARLVLKLHERMTQLKLADGPTFDFPLRHRHIADATGLTPVHVCKVFSGLTAAGFIRSECRSLTILDAAGLQEVAG